MLPITPVVRGPSNLSDVAGRFTVGREITPPAPHQMLNRMSPRPLDIHGPQRSDDSKDSTRAIPNRRPHPRRTKLLLRHEEAKRPKNRHANAQFIIAAVYMDFQPEIPLPRTGTQRCARLDNEYIELTGAEGVEHRADCGPCAGGICSHHLIDLNERRSPAARMHCRGAVVEVPFGRTTGDITRHQTKSAGARHGAHTRDDGDGRPQRPVARIVAFGTVAGASHPHL